MIFSSGEGEVRWTVANSVVLGDGTAGMADSGEGTAAPTCPYLAACKAPNNGQGRGANLAGELPKRRWFGDKHEKPSPFRGSRKSCASSPGPGDESPGPTRRVLLDDMSLPPFTRLFRGSDGATRLSVG